MSTQTAETTNTAAAPATAPAPALPVSMVGKHMSVAMQIMLDDRLFERVKWIATNMATAKGVVGDHLLGKVTACFAIVSRSMTWNLDPWAVAASTYETPGGKVGYEGKLCHAIIEASNRLDGPVRYTHFGTVVVRPPQQDAWVKQRTGKPPSDLADAERRRWVDEFNETFAEITPERSYFSHRPDLRALLKKGAEVVREKTWSAVQGKFEKKQHSKSGKDYMVPTWTRDDAEGLGVLVSAKVKGEVDPRDFEFELIQAFPLNSTLWATDPRTQICYAAVRRFCSLVVPHLFMGVPFDTDELRPLHLGPDAAKDVTPPRPTRANLDATPTIEPEKDPYEVVDADGEMHSFPKPSEAAAFFLKQLEARPDALRALVEFNVELMARFDEEKEVDQADAIRKEVARRMPKTDAGAGGDPGKAKAATADIGDAPVVDNKTGGQAAPAQATTSQPAAASKPAFVPVLIEVPTVKRSGAKDWVAYTDLCLAAVRKLKSEDEVKAWKEKQGANLTNLGLAMPNGQREIDEAIATIGAASK